MKIGIDLMAGDLGPEENIQAAKKYAEVKPNNEIYLYGDEDLVSTEIKNMDNVKIVHTKVKINSDDDPALAIKSKKDSSMALGALDLGNKKIDAFVTSGNTGAAIASGIFLTKRLEGIKKPALGAEIPGNSFILDLGANAEATVENLVTQAIIGKTYAINFMNIKNPKIGLLNIGAEDNKGSSLYKEVYKELMENDEINFIGNIESRYIFNNEADVLICDGFTGNMMLKSIEGTAQVIFSGLKKAIYANITTKIAGKILKPGLKELKNSLDYEEEGGTPIFGINGIIIKSHGSSNQKAILNALLKAEKMVEIDFLEKLKESL